MCPATVLNSRGYIDVTFTDIGGSGLKPSTLTDLDPEITRQRQHGSIQSNRVHRQNHHGVGSGWPLLVTALVNAQD